MSQQQHSSLPNSKSGTTGELKLLFIPGLGGNASIWQQQLVATKVLFDAEIASSHIKLASISEMAHHLLLKHQKPLILCGTSMGGMIALEMYRQAPKQIAGLALFGSTANAESIGTARLKRNSIKQINNANLASIANSQAQFAIYRKHPQFNQLRQLYINSICQLGSDILISQNLAIIQRRNQLPLLTKINCPTLVVCGKDDLLTPATESMLIAKKIPHSELYLLNDCAHMLTIEQPKLVSALLLSWLNNRL